MYGYPSKVKLAKIINRTRIFCNAVELAFLWQYKISLVISYFVYKYLLYSIIFHTKLDGICRWKITNSKKQEK